MRRAERSSDRFWERGAQGLGCLLGLLGLPAGLCGGLPWLLGGTSGWPGLGPFWFAISVACVGGGYLMWRQARLTLQGKPSRPLQFPPLWALGWGFLLTLVLGGALGRDQTSLGDLFSPAALILAAGLPPLMAVVWAVNSLPPASDPHSEGLTRWQFSLAFVGGATVSVGLAIALEILLPGVLLALVAGLFEIARTAWERLLEELAGGEVARALSSYGFVLVLIELALVAPLVEEFVKPLVVWPLLKRAGHPRQAFLLGVAAGAGFAALENLLYAGFGLGVWEGVVAVRALGAAVHPLGAGLVALAWYEAFQDAGHCPQGGYDRVRRWSSRFGLAVGLHALWNGGIVLLAALAGASFFGSSPPEVEIWGVTQLGVLLALLAVLGAGAWIGLRVAVRALGADAAGSSDWAGDRALARERADRMMATWALVCLVASLAIGLTALKVLGGGG